MKKKKRDFSGELSRRERQIMDIVYALTEATAAQVRGGMADAPSYSTVRKLLSILVEKNHLKYREESGKYFYRPTRSRDRAGKSALLQVLETFFEGSLEKAVAAMVSSRQAGVTDEELQNLSKLIDHAKSEGH